jgi:hypothetical protein
VHILDEKSGTIPKGNKRIVNPHPSSFWKGMNNNLLEMEKKMDGKKKKVLKVLKKMGCFADKKKTKI